ncbi:SphA family protein [Thiohalocapsa marina]|uniref:SphA family protein n=1 Tax=Thiohalocapsa marina TaxID=424902 RepID=UPI0036DC7291
MSQFKSVVLAATLAVATTATAKEGADQYPNGAEGFMAGALPPPGTYFLNYAGYYSGDRYDSNGDKVKGVSVEAWFDAPRIVHVTQQQFLGASYGFAALLPIVRQEISTPGGDELVTGIGDMSITPVLLGWHWPEFHMIAALDIFAPTGTYDKNNPARSIGANYWTFEPVLAFTYLNKQGWEASTKLMYSLRTENDATDYRSGNEFHMDYTLARHVGSWAFGLGGYYVKQVEEDELNGTRLRDSEGQVFAFGPQVKYDYKNMSFIGKWHHETEVENRFGGDKLWFKFVMAF